jgi:hypothetical protein
MCVTTEAGAVAVDVDVVAEGTTDQGIIKAEITEITECLGLYTMAPTAHLHKKKKTLKCSIYIFCI